MSSRKSSHQYLLAPRVTVSRYKELVEATPPDRNALAKMVRRRFEARFIEPVTDGERVRGGFATLALCCLGIQALQSFRSGKPNSNTNGAIKKFLKDNKEFSSLRGHETAFCNNIRHALHHQAQTDGGWRINISGPVFSPSSLSIGAQKFLDGFTDALARYCSELEATTDESPLWMSFLNKMKFVIRTCDAEAGARAYLQHSTTSVHLRASSAKSAVLLSQEKNPAPLG